MKEIFTMYARYLQDKDKKIYALLDGLSNADREKDRGSYYKSLSGLFRHFSGGAGFLVGMCAAALPEGSAAKKAGVFDKVDIPEGELTEAQWKALKPIMEKADQTVVDFTSKLTEDELKVPAKAPWMKEPVPLFFMLNMFITHQIHHQGQVSQILDELKIDNDYSGLAPDFLK
jgi:uncharacterized damage-inducible protein DinB